MKNVMKEKEQEPKSIFIFIKITISLIFNYYNYYDCNGAIIMEYFYYNIHILLADWRSVHS